MAFDQQRIEGAPAIVRYIRTLSSANFATLRASLVYAYSLWNRFALCLGTKDQKPGDVLKNPVREGASTTGISLLIAAAFSDAAHSE